MTARHVRLIDALVSKPEGASKTDLHAALGNNWPSSELEAALSALMEEGRIRREERRVGAKGRRHGVYLAVSDEPMPDEVMKMTASVVARRRRPMTDLSQQWIYFIQAVDGGPIRIGRAIDPEYRLAVFQSGCPVRLRILALTPGAARLERELHSRFAPEWSHGEWFNETPELLEYIRDSCERK